MVHKTGLEPARLPALEPKSSASAISPLVHNGFDFGKKENSVIYCQI